MGVRCSVKVEQGSDDTQFAHHSRRLVLLAVIQPMISPIMARWPIRANPNAPIKMT